MKCQAFFEIFFCNLVIQLSLFGLGFTVIAIPICYHLQIKTLCWRCPAKNETVVQTGYDDDIITCLSNGTLSYYNSSNLFDYRCTVWMFILYTSAITISIHLILIIMLLCLKLHDFKKWLVKMKIKPIPMMDNPYDQI